MQGAAVPSKAKSLGQLLSLTTVENLLANGGNIISVKEDDSIESVLKVRRVVCECAESNCVVRLSKIQRYKLPLCMIQTANL